VWRSKDPRAGAAVPGSDGEFEHEQDYNGRKLIFSFV
jgi:hypothetical protein